MYRGFAILDFDEDSGFDVVSGVSFCNWMFAFVLTYGTEVNRGKVSTVIVSVIRSSTLFPS